MALELIWGRPKQPTTLRRHVASYRFGSSQPWQDQYEHRPLPKWFGLGLGGRVFIGVFFLGNPARHDEERTRP